MVGARGELDRETTASAQDAQGTTRGGRVVVLGQYATERGARRRPLDATRAEYDPLPAFDGRPDGTVIVRRVANAPKRTTTPGRATP